ncbi:MAG: 1-propanol dehydrogenase PduQ [Propionibacteriaceae bacterium]|nr:1-propanol dehydrogenase PduQ [Propionibacteriaceae bacterium]
MKEFRLATRVGLGAEALAALDEFRDAPVFLVTDEFLATTPVYRQVVDRLGAHVATFTGVNPNPTTGEISAGVAAYVQARPQVVVAYGGGSVMDAAKVMHKAALEAGIGAPGGLVAIPTTSGSGSEVTSFAVVTDEATHTKIPIVSQDLVAGLAILDPQAVVGVPKHITADSGMDVLTHAIEAYVAANASDFSDALAEKAVELVLTHLERCFTHGDDLKARSHMHNASCMAAMAFDNAGLGIVHSLAHALGGRYPVAHGRLNALLLPHVIEFNAERSPWAAERYARLGRLVAPSATGRAAVTSLVAAVQRLRAKLGMPGRLSEVKVGSAELRRDQPELVAAALADGCTPGNPVAPSADDLRTILRKVA